MLQSLSPNDATATCESILKLAHHRKIFVFYVAFSEPARVATKSLNIDISINIASSDGGSNIDRGSGTLLLFKDS